MTPETFRTRIRALGLTIRQFAEITGVSEVTAGRWGGAWPFPAWVAHLLDAWDVAPASVPRPSPGKRHPEAEPHTSGWEANG